MQKKNVSKLTKENIPSWYKPKIRACAYIRVSTGHDKQLESLENQRQYYERTIQANTDYIFRGIFSDAGISGAKTNRPGFSAMLDEARSGNIDLILTKSISRFGRNTVLLLQSVRELKALGIGVVFEEQHINTLSSDGELMLTVLASIAEEEYKAVCGNIRWAVLSRYQRGEVSLDASRLLGYDKDKNNTLMVNEVQAEIVRYLFKGYLSGTSAYRLAKELNECGIPTYTKQPWSSHRILGIISNEKYTGDCLMQKSFVDEQGKQVRNRGQRDQYLISGNHPAIISRSDWEQAQLIRSGRAKKQYAFSSRLHCPACHSTLIRTVSRWGVDWVCGTHLHGGKAMCPGMRMPEDKLFAIADERHATGHYFVEEESNGVKNKREKSYRLIPATGSIRNG